MNFMGEFLARHLWLSGGLAARELYELQPDVWSLNLCRSFMNFYEIQWLAVDCDQCCEYATRNCVGTLQEIDKFEIVAA
jgi:hypothetical protein